MMQVSVEAGEGLERRMRIDLAPEQIAVKVEARLRELSGSVRLPGFRPGKVPMKILRQRYGDAVQHEVFSALVESSFAEALSDQSLRPAGRPTIEADIEPSEQRFGYTATFEILPHIELADLTGQVLKAPAAEVTESDLDAMLEKLRRQRGEWKAVERVSENGDRLTVDFEGRIEGETFQGGSGEGLRIELGAAKMLPGFEDGLVGTSAGDRRGLDLVFPDDYHASELAGKAVHFDVTVTSVEALEMPPVDAGLAQSFGIEDGDVERFRHEVRQNMERELKQRLYARKKAAVMEMLLEKHSLEVPRVLVESESQALREQMRQNLGMGTEDFAGATDEAARRRVALGLIIGEIIKNQGMTPDPVRVRAAIEEIASTFEDPQAVINYYLSNAEASGSIQTTVLEQQVVDWVLSKVEVQDEPTTFAELTDPGGARL